MTKYLLNLVCIIGIAGAAHAGAVANLEITEDGHAHLVFADGGNNQLTGYSIEDTAAVPTLSFLAPSAAQDGTGQYATAWSSLDDQGAFAGENYGTHDWFFDGSSAPPTFLGEGNIDGYLGRADGAPVYIGRILDTSTMGGVLIAADFQAGGRLENIEFKVTDTTLVTDFDNPENINTGTVTLRTGAPLATVTQDITGTPWQETGDIGATNTDFDATYVEHADGSGLKAVIDLKVASTLFDTIDTWTSTLTGSVMINGTIKTVTFADLVQTTDDGLVTGNITASLLRVKVIDGSEMISIHSNPTQAGKDAAGHWGTLASTMVVSVVAGDFEPDDDSDDIDIDLIGAAIVAGSNNLLYDVTGDGVVDTADRNLVILSFVERTGGNGTMFGDINRDGHVDAGDYTLWADNFGPGTGWASGDLNGNAETEAGDYTLWADNFGTGPNDAPGLSPVAVPEPATMMLLAVGGFAAVVRRRRRK